MRLPCSLHLHATAARIALSPTFPFHPRAVLMRLLGKSYSFEDVLCYALGTLAALSTGLSPSIAKVGWACLHVYVTS